MIIHSRHGKVITAIEDRFVDWPYGVLVLARTVVPFI